MLDPLSVPAAKLTSDPFYVLPSDSWKVLDFFKEINSLWLKSHQCGPPLKTALRAARSLADPAPVTFPFETSVLSWPWQHSAWVLYWICFSFDLLLIYRVLCAAFCSIGDRWMFFVSLIVSLIAWLWVCWMWSVYFSTKCSLLSPCCTLISPEPIELSKRAWIQLGIWKAWTTVKTNNCWLSSSLDWLLTEASDPPLGKRGVWSSSPAE